MGRGGRPWESGGSKELATEKGRSRARGNGRVEIRGRAVGSTIKEQSVGEALSRGEKVRHAQA